LEAARKYGIKTFSNVEGQAGGRGNTVGARHPEDPVSLAKFYYLSWVKG
jgi:hypothetical protein